jgi:hypothetical protein
LVDAVPQQNGTSNFNGTSGSFGTSDGESMEGQEKFIVCSSGQAYN